MAKHGNAAPVIIKRKKVVQGGGHHGGAWKVAYADFVTAMMAFFLLMWLLGATSEKQRKGLADYFSPTIQVNRISGGGQGMFGGDSVFTEETMPQSGTGASERNPTADNKAQGAAVSDALAKAEAAAMQIEIEKAMTAFGGESMTMERALRHVVTKVTDEGLVIEIFDMQDAPLFAEGTAEPAPIVTDIAHMLAEVLALAKNNIAVNGYVKSYPITLIDNPSWDLSSARAAAMRGLLEAGGLPNERVLRVSGFADHKPVTADPMVVRNNRIEVVLLRKDR